MRIILAVLLLWPAYAMSFTEEEKSEFMAKPLSKVVFIYQGMVMCERIHGALDISDLITSSDDISTESWANAQNRKNRLFSATRFPKRDATRLRKKAAGVFRKLSDDPEPWFEEVGTVIDKLIMDNGPIAMAGDIPNAFPKMFAPWVKDCKNAITYSDMWFKDKETVKLIAEIP